MGIIYRLTNSINGKNYIGQTVRTLSDRLEDHIKESRRPKYKIHYAIQKHGIRLFNAEILEECENSCLNEREEFWISKYNSFKRGYNSTSGGNHYALSEESKEKISNKLKGRKYSQETLEKMRLAKLGKKMSEETKEKHRHKFFSKETREKISDSNRKRVYKPHTMETIEKMRLAKLGKKMSEETKAKIGKATKEKFLDENYRTKFKSIMKTVASNR